jgi:hypothetical protein
MSPSDYLGYQAADLFFWGGLVIIIGLTLTVVVEKLVPPIKDFIGWLLEDDGKKKEDE